MKDFEAMRLIRCRLVNKTKYTWRWEDFRLQEYTSFNSFDHHSPWERKVDREVQPNQSTVSEMVANSSFRGVEAWVTYNTDAGPIEFHWNSPYVGSNLYET